MFTTQESRTGAASMARHARKNPTEVMVSLIEADPTASFDRIFKQWWDIVKADDDYYEAIGFHAGTNIWASLTRKRPEPKPSKTTQNARATEKNEQVARVVQKVLSRLTLDFVMPNGKRLADCTGIEVSKFGGVFSVIGKKAGNRIVGDVFTTDEQIQKVKGK